MYREYYKKIGDLWKGISEASKKLDPVGGEDKDIDNDGDHDKSDKYLHNRRKAVKSAIMKKEALDLDTKAVDKALTHDCAKHVTSEKWGDGECIPGQHTIVEDENGEGRVTHYDVMFEHGVEFDVPVEELTILVSESHKHTSKKMAKEETNKVSVSKDYAKHYKKATKPEKYGDTNSEGEKKFAAMHDFGKVELVYDDDAGHEDATKAGKITKKSSHPGNLHIGHKNFGD